MIASSINLAFWAAAVELRFTSFFTGALFQKIVLSNPRGRSQRESHRRKQVTTRAAH